MAAVIEKIQAPIDETQTRQSTCLGCRIKFDSAELQRAHFKTEWHSYNLKRRVCNLEPIDLNSFNLIQAAAPVSKRPTNQSQASASSRASVADNEEDWEDVDAIDDEGLLDEELTEEEAAEMLARVIKSDTCLFCDKKSNSVLKNLEHMNLLHGFFIPEDQYLIDLEGIMEYLGYKVGAGATCLWCNKQFTSVHGVRLHMMYKDHCKIMYDHGTAIDEFKEFYDYSTQEHFEMKPANQLVIMKRRAERRNGAGGTALVKSPLNQQQQQVVKRNNLNSLCGGKAEYRVAKKFNAARAKTLLRTGMANNNNFRHRLRRQNPIGVSG